MLRRTFLALAVLFLALLAAPAQEKSVRPDINIPFKNPDLDGFLKMFEVESREVYTQRADIVKACKLKPGMAVADIGAGTGLFTRLFAKEVGPKGKVFAVDIAKTFLDHIAKSAQEQKLDNITLVQCDQVSCKLPANSVDLVFICDTYHHFEFPQRTLATIHEALKPGGTLVLIDFKRIEGVTSEKTMQHVRAGQEVFTREVRDAGFTQLEEVKLLKENYLVRFERKAGALPRERVEGETGGDEGELSVKQVFKSSLKLPKAIPASLRLSADGKLLAFPEEENIITVLELSSQMVMRSIKTDEPKNIERFTPDNRCLVTTTKRSNPPLLADRRRIVWISLENGNEEKTLISKGSFQSLFFDCKHYLAIDVVGDRALSLGGMSVISTNTGEVTKKLSTSIPDYAGFSTLSDDGTKLAVQSRNMVRLLSTQTGKELFQFGRPHKPLYPVAISKSGKRMATSWGGTIQIWNGESGAIVREIKLPLRTTGEGFAFSPDEKWLAVGGIGDKVTAYLFDVATGRLILNWPAEVFGIRRFVFNSQGNMLVTAGSQVLQIWEISAQKVRGSEQP